MYQMIMKKISRFRKIFCRIFTQKNYVKIKLLKIFARFFPDKTYLKQFFLLSMGYKLNLDAPQTYNEKLQWLKLYDRNPDYTKMVDKYEVKKYVANIIGEEYIIPTIGIFNSVDEIDYDALPSRFVLKCTHDSGGIVICKDKSTFDIKEAKTILSNGLKRNYYYINREWPYKNVKPRIIVEKYMEDESGELRDYKIFCFDGEPKAMFIATDRFDKNEETKFDFFDMDFNHLPFTNGHPNATKKIERPKGFETMKKLAEKVSQGLPHVRVDFYDINGNIYFGEITFFHWSGMKPFNPKEWDYKFGSWLKLPMKNQK